MLCQSLLYISRNQQRVMLRNAHITEVHGTDQQLIQMTVGRASALITLPYDAVYDYFHMMQFMVRCIGIRAVVDHEYSVAMADILISDI